MFKIRAELMQRFAAARIEDFEDRLTAHLREYFPEEMAERSPEEMHEWVRGCVDRSAAFGLTSERAIACFAHVAMIAGPCFELDSDWSFLTESLRDERRHPDFRARRAMSIAHDLDDAGRIEGDESSPGRPPS